MPPPVPASKSGVFFFEHAANARKQQQIAEYENKNRYPRTDSLVKLVKALGCSSDYLLDLSEKPSEQVSTLSSNLALLLSTLSQKEQDRIERILKAMLSDDG